MQGALKAQYSFFERKLISFLAGFSECCRRTQTSHCRCPDSRDLQWKQQQIITFVVVSSPAVSICCTLCVAITHLSSVWWQCKVLTSNKSDRGGKRCPVFWVSQVISVTMVFSAVSEETVLPDAWISSVISFLFSFLCYFSSFKSYCITWSLNRRDLKTLVCLYKCQNTATEEDTCRET